MTNPYTQPAPPMTPSDEKLVATLTHIGGIFFGFWAPLVTYLIFRDRGPLVRQHTATALNFQLTMLIVSVIGAVTTLIAIGFLILAAEAIIVIVFGIMAAVAANNGQQYTYPLTITFVN
jgi:uncharacterized protein